ncbi:MAG: hypothetical protein IH977_02405 [Nitrospinae bacterium]|nr:hypothetical protein [Nitrospinota bacterium]
MTKRRAKEPSASKPAGIPQSRPDFTAPPWYDQILKEYQEKLPPPDENFTSSEGFKVGDVGPLLESGKLDTLCELLKHDPYLLAHPLIWGLVNHFPVARRQQNSAEAREIIESELHQILECWVKRMLPGYTLKPPPKGRGRRLSAGEEDFRGELFREYRNTLAELKRDTVAPIEGESDNSGKVKEYEKWKRRLVDKVLPKVWEKSTHSSWLGLHSADKDKPIHERRLARGTIAFPADKARAWVESAIKAADKRENDVLRDLLAYELLAFGYGLTVNQVRYIVEQQHKLTT